MTITLRQETQTGATTKGSSLTYAELDNNFIDLLTNKILPLQVDADTGSVTVGEAQSNGVLTVTGGTDITTSVTEDSAGNANITVAFSGSAGLANLVEDTTPQLGGSLDVNGNSIVSVSNGDITIAPDGTGKIVMSGKKLNDVQLENYKETVFTLTTDSAGSINIDVADGNVQKITLDQSVTFTGFANAEDGQSVTLILEQDITGNHTFSEGLASDGAMIFAGGNQTLSTTGGSVDIMSILYVGGVYYASLSTNFS